MGTFGYRTLANIINLFIYYRDGQNKKMDSQPSVVLNKPRILLFQIRVIAETMKIRPYINPLKSGV